MEPEDGEDHYTERLVRLPGIGVYYPRPIIPRPLLRKNRDDFHLGADRTVYLCCQSIFKYLPQHDDLFVRIAKRNPKAQFVFLAVNDVVAGDFEKRVQVAFAAEGLDSATHCVVLPQLSEFDYWNLNLIADVFLDSLEWSGGVTTLEAIACGLPIVTLPGEFMRGRHSFGILTQLGVADTVARDKQQYVDIAVRLGQDAQWRSSILVRMAAGHSQLYGTTDSIGALEDFYSRSVTDASHPP
jgi:predicted O-linked N-acetylglucosamine transferase (SPINDLY family)